MDDRLAGPAVTYLADMVLDGNGAVDLHATDGCNPLGIVIPTLVLTELKASTSVLTGNFWRRGGAYS